MDFGLLSPEGKEAFMRDISCIVVFRKEPFKSIWRCYSLVKGCCILFFLCEQEVSVKSRKIMEVRIRDSFDFLLVGGPFWQ